MKSSIMSVILCAVVAAVPLSIFAASDADRFSSRGLDPVVLVGLAAMLVAGKVFAKLFQRIGQPAVLGELLAGVVLGGFALIGFTGVDALKSNQLIATIAEIGVILLLFEVGLESNLKEMMEVGYSSLLVAVLGVVVPFFLGWGVSAYFLPTEPRLAHIFIGATLCATSVGITARVFKDLKKLATREARIILGAAVIDDILGLLILAVVGGAIRASTEGNVLSIAAVGLIALKAIGFLFLAIVLGQFLVPRILSAMGRLNSNGVLITFAIAFCFLLAWCSTKVGLAPIIGAFAAGLVLDEVHYKRKRQRQERDLQTLLRPVSAIFVPVFFVWMGLKVNLSSFARTDTLGFALALTVVAILGKQICSLGVMERTVDRLVIGLGMIPRGEVGLIFASIGATLLLPNSSGEVLPVINSATFAAIIIMVVITTFVTPPALKWSLDRSNKDQT